ncbi:MAG: carboxypeptidase-like regulatory domain-containing protein [Blastocatellia bacterium]
MTRKTSPAVWVTIAVGILILLSPLAAYPNKQDLGGKIFGRVVERDTGMPLAAEIGVAMRGPRGITLDHVRATEQGLFELAGLPPADVQFNTKLAGYAVEHQNLALGEGETRWIEFHLVRAVTVRGRVLDPAGAPIEDAQIRVVYARDAAPEGPIAATYQWESGEVRSDKLGNYSVAVHPGKDFLLEASHAKYQPVRDAVRRAADPAARVEQAPLRLTPKRQDEQ